MYQVVPEHLYPPPTYTLSQAATTVQIKNVSFNLVLVHIPLDIRLLALDLERMCFVWDA